MAQTSSPPALQEATKNSTTAWQGDLESLFHHAKDRFPDVVWELSAEDGDKNQVVEEVWGHKAIVYARAPPSFQSRYFSFRPNPASSPHPYSSSPTGTLPTASALSLLDVPGNSRTPSPFRSTSPASTAPPANPGPLLRIPTSINPALFSNELEYLYTGQGFGEAFEFLFDAPESHEDASTASELRIDKLRKDLVFMWRSRLYSDVRIALTGNFSSSSPGHESTTAIFSSHRFVLISRSPYFHTALVSWPNPLHKQPSNEPLTLTLPSPPFTPASLHFTLGFIYTGTLVFSHRSYDLTTAFHILRSATYLSLQTLYDEIQARIVQEMMHGLFHAFLPFAEYESITGGKWGTGGCRCRQCARRAPRILEFAMSDDVKNPHLDRGARRALVGLFGEGWCTPEFSSLPQKTRDSLLKGVAKRTTPLNVFALLFAAEHAMNKLNAVIDAWADIVREMILAGRKGVDEVLCGESEKCFGFGDGIGQNEWSDLMEGDGVGFDDAERVEWVMASVGRGANERNAAILYQTLVSSILLRPHPTEYNAPMLSSTSHVRVQVEQARMDLLGWIGKRWVGIRQEGGFDELEGWALKEISDNIEVPLDDLLLPAPKAKTKPSLSSSLKPEGEFADSMSVRSVRSVASRTTSRRGNTPTTREPIASSSASVRSVAKSTFSTVSRSTIGAGPASPRGKKNFDLLPLGPRPDSKLTPQGQGRSSSLTTPSKSPTPRPSIIVPQVGEREEEEEYIDHEQAEEEEEERERQKGIEIGAELDRELAGSPISTTRPINKTLVKVVSPASSSSSTTASIRSTTARARARPSTVTSSSAASFSSANTRPKSSASSISVRSRASTIRTSSSPKNPTSSSLRLPPQSRPTSTLSNTSDGSASNTGTYMTAPTAITPSSSTDSRQTSSTSSLSVRTASGSTGGKNGSTVSTRSRRTSNASTTSVMTTARSTLTSSTGAGKRSLGPSPDPSKLTPASSSSAARKRRPSVTSIKSTNSTVSTAASAAKKAVVTVRRPVTTEKKTPASAVRSISGASDNNSDKPIANSNGNVSIAVKGKSRASALASNSDAATGVDHKKTESTASTGSASTLKRKGSSDTITSKITTSAPANRESNGSVETPTSKKTPIVSKSTSVTSPTLINLTEPLPLAGPRGATLEIGIPCIISSKRKRFKAFARYIGEVEGERGPWVGVEVPVGGESWANEIYKDKDRLLDGGAGGDGGRQWHDGTWGGIRYFEINNGGVGGYGGGGSEWGDSGYDYGFGEDRAARRRRVELSHSGPGGIAKGMLKREGDQLSVDRAKRVRSASPAISDASNAESRGLFVRPQQVLYVVDAVGSDL